MKLVTFQIRDYKSVRNSTPIHVGEVTCLVGKNESGKTAVLQALYKLNPVVPEDGKFDVTDEYPRSEVEEYRQRVEDGEIAASIVVTADYALEPAEIESVEAVFGEGVLPDQKIRLSKGYKNTLYADLTVNEAIAVRFLVKKYKLPSEVADAASVLGTIEALNDFLDSDGQERQKNHASARTQAETLPDPDARIKAIHEADLLAESEASKRLKGLLTSILEQGLSIYIWTHHLATSWPKFLYFGVLSDAGTRQHRETQRASERSERPET